MTVENKAALRISAVGDISLGDHPVCVGHGMRSAFSKRGFEIVEEISKCFESADLVLANAMAGIRSLPAWTARNDLRISMRTFDFTY